MKNSVYVLPDTAQSVEDFEWLRTEIAALGGEARVLEASSTDAVDAQELLNAFQSARTQDFARLGKEIKALRARTKHGRRQDEGLARAIRALRERFEEIRRIDFFPTGTGAEIEAALLRLQAIARPKTSSQPRSERGGFNPRSYQHRTWVTRPRPGVDRFSSAWLIRRFIDTGAKFVFASSPDRFPDAVPFDMYQSAGFKHEGDRCTFEVLQAGFGINDSSVRKIGEIVHDLDLKDVRYQSPHALTIGHLVEGFRASIAADADLLDQGIALFEALYQSLHSTPSKHAKGRIC
ncbi:MAG: chromate resistance protein [Vicinamibacterales bacterium]|nr:chromate resistance protein [Vicinamibacterales bacterium]